MAKKSARKEITKINLKQAALEGLSYERACETAKRAGKPSYRFTVGDKVQVGHLLNCVVDEALEGGYMYLIRSGANSDNYSCWAWTNVRPLDDDKDTHFAKRNSALSRLHYSNRSMYSLLSFQYLLALISTLIISVVLFGMMRTGKSCWTASLWVARLVVSSLSSCHSLAQATMATTMKSLMASSVC